MPRGISPVRSPDATLNYTLSDGGRVSRNPHSSFRVRFSLPPDAGAGIPLSAPNMACVRVCVNSSKPRHRADLACFRARNIENISSGSTSTCPLNRMWDRVSAKNVFFVTRRVRVLRGGGSFWCPHTPLHCGDSPWEDRSYDLPSAHHCAVAARPRSVM